ncbi:MAG TPA: hypothetical protein VE084_22495, partial [Burkholderiaceae bacterium]|nr:hypothetical protein [Burkholderiaceae bacterium]
MSLRLLAGAALALPLVVGAVHAWAAGAEGTPSAAIAELPCDQAASSRCFIGFDLPGAAGRLHYYASRGDAGTAEAGTAPTTALVV